MNSFFPKSKRSVSITASLISAAAFLCTVACITAAAPLDRSDAPQPVDIDQSEHLEVTAPDPIDEQISASADGTIHVSQAVKTSSPETATDPMASSEETTALHEETTAPEETEVPEDAEISDETMPPEDTAEPEEPEEPEEPFPAPKLPSVRFLADDLGIEHTIKMGLIPVTQAEVHYAATLIQLEVMGPGTDFSDYGKNKDKAYWEMLAVAQVVRNRMESERFFPDTAYDVMFQAQIVRGVPVYQFQSPKTINAYTHVPEAYAAAYDVLVTGVTILPENYYFFCASNIEDYFEESNPISLIFDENGEAEKMRGRSTTFYASHKD